MSCICRSRRFDTDGKTEGRSKVKERNEEMRLCGEAEKGSQSRPKVGPAVGKRPLEQLHDDDPAAAPPCTGITGT